ncbi:hypothetical protein J1605_021604 [Eschrichtius robustus]|uniref:V-type proton ATPase subunit C n=1 Tax=Eschrichtius robustus TaxID=9764 RepID=A0AB34HFW2_ESCRO|nr:hypothetical protein J1605_021604 [Eschrichtius robustus]
MNRYGLPVNFQAVLLQPHKKSSTKRLREVLNSVFRHLDEVAATSILDVGILSRKSCLSTGADWGAENTVSAQRAFLKQKSKTRNEFMHLEHDHVFCRHPWRSLDCNSATKTTFLMSISTSTLVFLTRNMSRHR